MLVKMASNHAVFVNAFLETVYFGDEYLYAPTLQVRGAKAEVTKTGFAGVNGAMALAAGFDLI